MSDGDTTKEMPDTLTQRIGVLARRETEARVVAPVVEALADAFGREEVLSSVRDTIVKIAQEQGGGLAEAMGGRVGERGGTVSTQSVCYLPV